MAINVAIIPILCSVAMLIRICRIFKSMRQGTDYVPVSETVELELESEPRPRPSRTPSRLPSFPRKNDGKVTSVF